MATYRLYFLSPRLNHIEGFDEYEASGDSEAIERADRRSDQAPLELWSGRRKIHQIDGPARMTATPAGAPLAARGPRLSLFART